MDLGSEYPIYSIGSPLLGKFSQTKSRCHLLRLLEISWHVGPVYSRSNRLVYQNL